MPFSLSVIPSLLLNAVYSKAERHPFYQAEQVIPYLHDIQSGSLFEENKKVVILFSGDSGFYSGCQPLYAVAAFIFS